MRVTVSFQGREIWQQDGVIIDNWLLISFVFLNSKTHDNSYVYVCMYVYTLSDLRWPQKSPKSVNENGENGEFFKSA